MKQNSFQLDCGAFYVCPKVGGKVHLKSNNGAAEFPFGTVKFSFTFGDIQYPSGRHTSVHLGLSRWSGLGLGLLRIGSD